ncbi:MAG: ATP synthase F1 subunit delta [Bacteroidales bacterium]|nr:ATP synthase F1 subunit delta [Bacteroidales bacterium]
MNLSKISVRYAKALLISAKEANQMSEIYSDVSSLFQVFAEVKELEEVFANPTIKESVKLKIVEEISAKANKFTQNFMRLVVQNGREQYFQNIFRNFIDFYKKEMGIKAAQITTVVPLSQSSINSVRNMLAEHFKAEIEFTEKQDKSLIGGFIVQVDDVQIDTSIKTQLDQLKRELTKDTYKSKLN